MNGIIVLCFVTYPLKNLTVFIPSSIIELELFIFDADGAIKLDDDTDFNSATVESIQNSSNSIEW